MLRRMNAHDVSFRQKVQTSLCSVLPVRLTATVRYTARQQVVLFSKNAFLLREMTVSRLLHVFDIGLLYRFLSAVVLHNILTLG